jgi:hypothetical protein
MAEIRTSVITVLTCSAEDKVLEKIAIARDRQKIWENTA